MEKTRFNVGYSTVVVDGEDRQRRYRHVLQLLIARSLGADMLGNFFLSLGLAAVLSTILTAGFPWIVAPVVARSEAEAQPGLLQAFLRCAHKQLALLSVLIAVPAGLIIWFYPGLANELRWALLIGVATAPIYAVMRLNGNLANARKRFIIANAPELLARPVFLVSFVGAAVLLSVSLDTATIVAINLGIATALATWMSVVMSRQTGTDLLQAKTHEPVAPKQMKQWRTLALPMVLATLFVAMFADLNILMVGSIMTASETGIFGVSIKITFLMAFAIQIVHQVMLRDASDAHLLKNHQALQATVRKANRFAVAITLSGFVFLILFGSYVLGFFGAGFAEGYAGMIGLMIAQVIRAAAGPAIQILMISGNQRASIPVYIASILLLFVANLLFVPVFGFVGAAVAVILTTLFWTVWLNRIVRLKVGISVSVFAGW
ncbi:MAG: hypothetical protein JKX70_03590 [Phycisphaerales bacterium]|nr:hypothetical protein [Phycisphaerales bacterium]